MKQNRHAGEQTVVYAFCIRFVAKDPLDKELQRSFPHLNSLLLLLFLDTISVLRTFKMLLHMR